MDTPPPSSIAVVYLARKAEGLKSFRAFVDSYASHPAGINHDLVVVFKGYDGKSDLEEARAEFSAFSFTSVEVKDEGFDIGSYLEAAKCLPHQYLCCFNTFSKILADGWLKKLHSHAALPFVGIVGATGSYESTRDSITLIQKAIWLNSLQTLDDKLRINLNKYFGSFFPHVKNDDDLPNTLKKNKAKCRRLIDFIFQWKNLRNMEKDYLKWWEKVQKMGDIANFCQFPSFPNPHIRSTAFMIKQEHLLAFRDVSFNTKLDVCHFESGYSSITRKILNAGLKARIVDRNGIGYDVGQWAESNTFRMENQSNLLVADNQTDFYNAATYEIQLFNALISWGSNALHLPNDFPDLGISFRANHLNTSSKALCLSPK